MMDSENKKDISAEDDGRNSQSQGNQIIYLILNITFLFDLLPANAIFHVFITLDSIHNQTPSLDETVTFSVGDQAKGNSETPNRDTDNTIITDCDENAIVTAKELSETKELEVESEDKNNLCKLQNSPPVINEENDITTERNPTSVAEASMKTIRPTQSHPKMSRMPQPPTLFKVGRTARSLGSISSGAPTENSNSTKINSEDENLYLNGSSSTGASSSISVNKRAGRSTPIVKQINSQDSLKGKTPQNLLISESPIDSKGKFIVYFNITCTMYKDKTCQV